MINLFVASGNLGQDIDVRYTPNQKCIGTLSLPVKSGWGENEKTAWVRCKILGDRAEKLAPYLTKGSQVTVQGRFELEEWTKDGVKHSIPCIIVNEIMLPPKTEATTFKPIARKQESPVLTAEELDALSDDIPF